MLSLLVLATPALAHAPSPGLQGFWRGVQHPLTDLMQLPLLVAFALLIGPLGIAAVRRGLLAFAIATPIGFAAGLKLGAAAFPAEIAIALLAAAALISLLAIIRLPLPPAACSFVGVLAGTLAGFANVPDQGALGAFVVTSLGALVAVNLVAMFATAGIDYVMEEYDLPWLAIGWRILAAWTLTIAVLTLAITLR